MIIDGPYYTAKCNRRNPATLSHDIVTGILREEMKYNGIIITDSMAMNAIANWYSSDEAAVKAIQAGCDMILMPYQLESAVNGIETAVNSGDINGRKNRRKCFTDSESKTRGWYYRIVLNGFVR